MTTKSRKILIPTLAFLVLLAQPTSVFANNSKNPKSNKSDVVTAWILPSGKSKKVTVAQLGRTLPIKFRLVVGEQIVTTTEAVYLKLEASSSCAVGTATTLVKTLFDPTITRPTPTATSDTTVEKLPTLRVENGIFKFNWKIDKSIVPGCYVLTAEKGSLKLSSPIIKVRAPK